MFEGLPPDEADRKARMLLEHELRAAIRIIGYLVDQQGGETTVPHRVLGLDYSLAVFTSRVDDAIVLKAKVAPRP